MSLRFIVGRAGSGKSHICLEQIRQELLSRPEGPPIILLVPEQATFQYEYSLATTPGLKGTMRAQVLSFRRLAWRVLQEVGGAARAHIGELGKRMVLRRILERRKSELKIFQRAARQAGFTDSLATTLAELKTYRITPEDLQQSMDKLKLQEQNTVLEKLEDLHLLYKDLTEFLADRFTDPDDYLNLLAERLVYSPTVQGADIYIDGFTGFTPQEYAVIEKILGTAKRVQITLCFDPSYLTEPCGEEEMFYLTVETYHRLKEMADALRIRQEPPLQLTVSVPFRFQHLPALAHLERHYYSRPVTTCQEKVGIKLVACANRRAEVEAAAREIIRLSRDKGLRWREMVVLLRDLNEYHQIISNVFDDYGIPVFIDHKQSVLHHPLVELIRSALETAIENWSYDPVFRYLKTDLVPLERGEVDRLENYVLTYGIRGSRWIDGKPWTYRKKYTLEEDQELSEQEDRELAEINSIRHRAVAHLKIFTTAISQASSVRQMTTALFDLLQSLQIAATLEKWAKELEEQGRLTEAKQYAQLWNNVLLLLDEIVEALGEEELSLEEYSLVLEEGLENLKLGLIPPGLDQVVVGTLERSRNPNVRAALILGISDGVLPARLSEEGIISDYERETLREIGLNLAPGTRRKLFDEQFHIYTALTRASEELYLSYPQADDEGKGLAPSQVIGRIKELLPQLEEQVVPVEPSGNCDLEFIATPGRSLSFLAAKLRDMKRGQPVDSLWQDVYSWFVGQPELGQQCRRILAALFHVNQEPPLAKGLGQRLYGRRLKTSVSRLEKFTACPFAHYLSYGLRLKERGQFQLGAPDLGQFFHAALKIFVERLKEQNIDWGQLTRQQGLALTGEIVAELAPKLQNEILLSTARYRYLIRKLQRTLERAIFTLTEHAKRGSFRPLAVELSFGEQGELPPTTINLEDGCVMQLSGRIDRIDCAWEGGQPYLAILDYKSGLTDIKLTEIYHGLKLQLLTYLDVALTYSSQLLNQDALPAGMLYFSVRDPLLSSSGPLPEAKAAEEMLKQLKMKGLLLGDKLVIHLLDGSLTGTSPLLPVGYKKDGNFTSTSRVITEEQFELLRKYLQTQLRAIGQRIISGEINISPYRQGQETACRFCIFKPVCQFDPLQEENLFRILVKRDDHILWSLIRESLGDHHE